MDWVALSGGLGGSQWWIGWLSVLDGVALSSWNTHLANILNTLDVEEHFKYMQSTRDFQFDVYDIVSSLVFACAVAPLSKTRTFAEILPSLYKKLSCSYDQILSSVEFIGSEYEKFIEIFTIATEDNYGIVTSSTYYDCTNFYFEINKETDFKRKGIYKTR